MSQPTSLQAALTNAPLMRGLIESPGWVIVQAEIHAEMEHCTRQVMEREDDADERARLIQRYRNLKECAEKPQRILDAAHDIIEADSPREMLEDQA